MITNRDEIKEYLEKYYNGKIYKGKGIDVPALDNHIRYKQGQLVIVNGHDNVGKTVFMMWYFLQLSIKHNLKWCIWSGENSAGQLTRQLIQMLAGKFLKDIELSKVYLYEIEISQWFTFIDNKGFYTPKELYKYFLDSKCDGALIDPYTGLNRGFSHQDNYEFLNETRAFCNNSNITIYVNTHPNTEATRRKHPKEHILNGYHTPPSKSECEGGQPFPNRTDDFITLHRYVGHPEYKNKLLFFTRKVRDVETGGDVNNFENPIVFDYNKGLGFVYDSEIDIYGKKHEIDFRANYTDPFSETEIF